NLLALPQTNIKRLLAYSSVAHAGSALIGVVAFSQLGAASVVFYLAAYIATNLLAFGVVMAFSRITGLEDITDYAGLSRRNPLMGLMMLTAFLSLAPVWRFCCESVRFCGGCTGKLHLAGRCGYRQLDHRCVLLPQCVEVCVPVPHGRGE
ncbi:MAG: hypothetical protein JNM02_13775, partial [Anaerolineales bacterium]|nr:hypothetical protein [Anaerolineales bacterium]